MNADRDARILVAEAQVARQRDLVARLKASGGDTSEAKSMLSGLRYSLRLLKQHQRRSRRLAKACEDLADDIDQAEEVAL